MARLPDGLIFIPKFEDMTTNNMEPGKLVITMVQRELVCCKNCIHGYDWNDGRWKCLKNGEMHVPGWFCADGKKED